jgi:hypothetical protein
MTGCSFLGGIALWILGSALQTAVSTVLSILIPIALGLILLLILSKAMPHNPLSWLIELLIVILKRSTQSVDLQKGEAPPPVILTPAQASSIIS